MLTYSKYDIFADFTILHSLHFNLFSKTMLPNRLEFAIKRLLYYSSFFMHLSSKNVKIPDTLGILIST